MNKPKLILLGTYFNEIDFIEAALLQAKQIGADVIMLCDGCFDEKHANFSTDGTREKIKAFCDQNDNAKFFEAIRLNRIQHILRTILLLIFNRVNPFSRAAVRALLDCVRLDTYRLNQAATFNEMAKQSGMWHENNWVMTMDCDQFYNDDMLKNLHDWITEQDIDVIVGNELTFFRSFHQFTANYEARDHNNMPHKIKPRTFFLPTRHLVTNHTGALVSLRQNADNTYHCGNMYHYRLRSEIREKLTYELGDRKPPSNERMITTKYNGSHPTIVEKVLLNDRS